MKRSVFAFIVFSCFLLYSCGIGVTVYLEPYHSKKEIREVFPLKENGNVTIKSNMDYLYCYELYEPKCNDKNEYILYLIELWTEQNTEPRIEITSVTVTECDEPIPFSVFYKTYPGQDEPLQISIPFIVENRNSHKFFVKIKKRYSDTDELFIRYQINIDGVPVIKEHQYKKQYAISSKHCTFFKYWIRTCE